jgi:hypothetical protein
MRIQRENPNYCAEKNAVFRTHRCRENEDEEIISIPHPTRGYMVQDVCKKCLQRGRSSMRRGRSESDDDEVDAERRHIDRRQRALPRGEAVVRPDFLHVARTAMVRDEDPRARARAQRLAAIERRENAVPMDFEAVTPARVHNIDRERIRQARLERLGTNEQQLNEARRRSLRRSIDERRNRFRNRLSGRGASLDNDKRKKTRFGGMAIFSNKQKAPMNTKKTSKKKQKR